MVTLRYHIKHIPSYNRPYLGDIGQLWQPAILHPADELRPADAVPDTGEPMGEQDEHEDQQNQHGGPVLQVVVQLPHHTAQT